jgi:prevent-host-death family protein
MPRTCSVAETKATLAERLREVERGEPIVITRHGRPVAALVSPEDLAQVLRLRAAARRGLASLAGGWEGSDELADVIQSAEQLPERAPLDLD